jgi:hypothetical protein
MIVSILRNEWNEKYRYKKDNEVTVKYKTIFLSKT